MRYFLLLVIFTGLGLNICAQPSVSAIAPQSGPAGSTVTITGSNFDPVAANNKVYFGAARAVVNAATTTSLDVTVPAGATYDLVTVTTNNLTAWSKTPFILTFPGAGPAFTPTSFAAHEDFTIVWAPSMIANVDIDEDGKTDLVTTTSNNVDICLKIINQSTPGNLSFQIHPDRQAGNGPGRVDYADIDGDGKRDIVFPDYDDRSIWVLRNTSTPGNVTFDKLVLTNINYGSLSQLKIADMDGDGKPDLVTAWDCCTKILRNTSTPGNISFVTPYSLSQSVLATTILIRDFDGDGKSDIAVARDAGPPGSFRILRNTSIPGTFSFDAPVSYPVGISIGELEAGDLDGDGKPDIVALDYTDNKFLLFRNTGTPGTLSFDAPQVQSTTGELPNNSTIGDLDGDGKPELVIGCFDFPNTEPVVAVYKNQSTPGMINLAVPVKYATAAPIVGEVKLGDMDGDGRPDIITGDVTVNKFSVLLNRIGCVDATINLQPAANNICAGASVSFTVGASQATGYQWQVDQGSGWTDIVNSGVYAGAVTNQLDITGATVQMNNYRYRCVVKQSCGQIYSLDAVLTVNPASTASVGITADRTAVCGLQPITFKAIPVNGGSAPAYQWKKNSINVGTSSDTYINNTPAPGDVVQCEMTSNTTTPCLVSAVVTSNMITLTQAVLPPPVDLGLDRNVCTGDAVLLDASAVYSSYLWQDGSSGSTYTANASGKFYVEVKDMCGTVSSDTVLLNFNPRPAAFLPKDTTVCSAEPIVLIPLQPYNQYLWNTGAITPSLVVATPGLYWLEVKDANGCPGRDTINVLPGNCRRGLFMPNAFTPNGDGKNDVFRPSVFGVATYYELRIFNRYGELVFQTRDPLKGWDGTYKGKKHNSGTLIWHCTYQVEQLMRSTETGTLLLIR